MSEKVEGNAALAAKKSENVSVQKFSRRILDLSIKNQEKATKFHCKVYIFKGQFTSNLTFFNRVRCQFLAHIYSFPSMQIISDPFQEGNRRDFFCILKLNCSQGEKSRPKAWLHSQATRPDINIYFYFNDKHNYFFKVYMKYFVVSKKNSQGKR